MPSNGTTTGRRASAAWPRYESAVTGFRNYWYPAARSRRLRTKPVTVQILDEPIVLLRENGRVHALFDQCPHRGIPLSIGRKEFPGTWTCRYHGWTFDLETGVLKAALTDGPDSPICGKVRVKTYPAEERAGFVWVYMGEGAPPPVEEDMPPEVLEPGVVLLSRMSLQRGNWRYACENAFDEGHFKYLHRYGAIHTFAWKLPAWSRIRIVTEPGGWVSRETESISFGGVYPGLGRWPRSHFWNRRPSRARISMRLPGIMRNEYVGTPLTKDAWYVPVGADRYRYLQLCVFKAPTLTAKARTYLRFWAYLRWAELVQFNNQDSWMVSLMPETSPDRLYRPDVSITAWRKLCEHARDFSDGDGRPGAQPASDQPRATELMPVR